MARVKIEDIIEHLDHEFKRALEDTVNRFHPEVTVNRNALFREFVRAIRRKCSTWENVPDYFVEAD